MLTKLSIVKIFCSEMINKPLEVISSDHKSLGSKILSGLAVGILSCFSLGIYAVHAHKYFANKKVGDLQKNLENAVRDGNLSQVIELLKKHPMLKTNLDLLNDYQNQSYLSLTLPIAAESGNLQMVKLLIDNGASLEGFSRGQKTAIELALDKNNKAMIYLLLSEGSVITQDALSRYLTKKDADIEVGIKLVEKIKEINSMGRKFSVLSIAAENYDKDLTKDKRLIQLLIEKGDRLVKGDEALDLSDEVKKLINEEIQKV